MIRTPANGHAIQLQGSKENWDGVKGTPVPCGPRPALLSPARREQVAPQILWAPNQRDLCPLPCQTLYSPGVLIGGGGLEEGGPQWGCVSFLEDMGLRFPFHGDLPSALQHQPASSLQHRSLQTPRGLEMVERRKTLGPCGRVTCG